MRRSKTSGIIATLNQEAYIRESVESLVHQVDELIVIDDGSTDGTAGILAGLNFGNLTIISHPESLGVSNSFNEAAQLATSEFLIIQGGDDVSLEHRVSEQISALQTSSSLMAFSLPMVINHQGRTLPDEVAGEFFYAGNVLNPFRHLFFVGNYICAPSVAIRRDTYLKWGGFSPASLYLQDYDLWCAVAAEGKIIQIPNRVVRYRKHTSNLSKETLLGMSRKDFRFDAEMDFVLDRALRRADSKAIRDLALIEGFSEGMLSALEREDIIALLQVSHPQKSQIRRGLNHLFKLCESPEGQEKLAWMKITQNDLSDLSMKADHNNRSQMARFDFKLKKFLEGNMANSKKQDSVNDS